MIDDFLVLEGLEMMIIFVVFCFIFVFLKFFVFVQVFDLGMLILFVEIIGYEFI